MGDNKTPKKDREDLPIRVTKNGQVDPHGLGHILTGNRVDRVMEDGEAVIDSMEGMTPLKPYSIRGVEREKESARGRPKSGTPREHSEDRNKQRGRY